MKKQILLFVMYLLPMAANADESGTCGENLTWSYDLTTKTLTISGDGEMIDYKYEDIKPWASYKFEKLIVGTGINSIGNYAFYSCSSLKEIILPTTLTKIGENAFANCTGLTSISLPGSVTSLSWAAFNSCTSLTSIYLANGLTTIGNYVFDGCVSLTTISIPKSVTTIYSNAFQNCKLESIVCRCPLAHVAGAFSDATNNHAVLYVPEGKRWEAIYDGGWYKFINIRETAMDASQLSPVRAYTLMNAQTYAYSVYDAVNNRLKNVEDFYNVDENIANNSWQIVEVNGKKCLYNIGAKKYAQISSSGEWAMSETAIPLDLQSDEDGKISINGQNSQWYFVLNDHLSPDNSATAIDAATNGISTPNRVYYTLDGRPLNKPRKGINIVRMNNGKTKKLVLK